MQIKLFNLQQTSEINYEEKFMRDGIISWGAENDFPKYLQSLEALFTYGYICFITWAAPHNKTSLEHSHLKFQVLSSSLSLSPRLWLIILN